MNKRRMIGIFLFLAVGIMGAAGIFFVLNKGNDTMDVFANMGISANPSTVNLEVEIEKSNDPALPNPFYIVETGNETITFNVNVSGLPKTASTMIYVNSLSPEVAFAAVEGVPDEKGNSTVRVTAKNGGTAQIKITSASGRRVIYVTVNVKLEAKGIRLNPGVHNAIVQKDGATAVLTFDEAKFTYLSHPDDVGAIYRANTHTVEYTWSPVNTKSYNSVRVVNNTLEVDADPTVVGKEVWVRSTITKTGQYADFPVYIFKPFTPVRSEKVFDAGNSSANLTPDEFSEPADPNDGGLYAEYGELTPLDLIHNRLDQREEKSLADYTFSMPEWGKINTIGPAIQSYGIMASAENESVITSQSLPSLSGADIGAYRFGSNNILGRTALNVIVYPIAEMSILRGSAFAKESTRFNLGGDTVVQKKVSMPAYNRNEFRREDESLREDGKMYFERDGKPLQYQNYDINKNGVSDGEDIWEDKDGSHVGWTDNNSDGIPDPNNGDVLYAFSYAGAASVPEQYYTEFKIGTVEKAVNAIEGAISNDVVFEAVFVNRGTQYTISAADGGNLSSAYALYDYFDIRADGVPLSRSNYHAPYTSTFTIAVKPAALIQSVQLDSHTAQLWLRVKSYEPLTLGAYSNLGDANRNGTVNNDYAIAEIGLSITRAIDDFLITKLPQKQTTDYNAVKANDMDTISLIIPDNKLVDLNGDGNFDEVDPNNDYNRNITPKVVVYGSSFVNAGNPLSGDWELDATKVKVDAFGAPIKLEELRNGRQVKVARVAGQNNGGEYLAGGLKYVSGEYVTFDKNGNGVEDNFENDPEIPAEYKDLYKPYEENWAWTPEWMVGLNPATGVPYNTLPSSYDDDDRFDNVISDFTSAESRRTNLVEYVFSVDVVEYKKQGAPMYKEFPVRFTYPNGVYHEVKVVIYPYVADLNTSFSGLGGGYVYEQYKIDGADISQLLPGNAETALENMDAPNRETQSFGRNNPGSNTPDRSTPKNDRYSSIAFLRIGASYELGLTTLMATGRKDEYVPADVGARATFSEVTRNGRPYADAEGESVFVASRSGEYEALVTLTAANDDVFPRFQYDWEDTNAVWENGAITANEGFQKNFSIDSGGEIPADKWEWSGFRRSWYVKIIVVNPIMSAAFNANDLALTAASTYGVGDEVGKAFMDVEMQIKFADNAVMADGTMDSVDFWSESQDFIAVGAYGVDADDDEENGFETGANNRWVVEGTTTGVYGFRVTGKFETEETVELRFHLSQTFSLADVGLPDFVLPCPGGELKRLNVDISFGEPVEEITLNGDGVGTGNRYIGLEHYSGGSVYSINALNIFPETADNPQIGFAIAKFGENGKWELGYTQDTNGEYVFGYSVLNDGGAKNMKRDGTGNRKIVEIIDVNSSARTVTLLTHDTNTELFSDTQIGLVAYALDSMRRVKVSDEISYYKPLTYSVVPLFVGPPGTPFGDLTDQLLERVSDANSGMKNNRGTYNWVVQAAGDAGKDHAALFWTNEETYRERAGVIVANRYYIDDLFQVLGWPLLNPTSGEYPNYQHYWTVSNQKGSYSGQEVASLQYNEFQSGGRPWIDVKNTGSFTMSYRNEGETGYKKVGDFDVISGLSTVDIKVDGFGVLSRQTIDANLSSPEANYEYNRGFTVRQGVAFKFAPVGFAPLSGLNAETWDAEVVGPTVNGGTPAYSINQSFNGVGGRLTRNTEFSITPYYRKNSIKYPMPSLRSTIPVSLIKGAKSLNIIQRENTIDGHTAAIYDINLVTDTAVWNDSNGDGRVDGNDTSLLNYEFSYKMKGDAQERLHQLFLPGSEIGPGRTKVAFLYRPDDSTSATGAYLVFTLTHVSTTKLPEDASRLIFYEHRVSIKVAISVDPNIVLPTPPDTGNPEEDKKNAIKSPIPDIEGGELTVSERPDLASDLFHTELSDTAAFNMVPERVYNLQFEHFANVETVDITSLRMNEAQSGNRQIFADSSGGLMKVFTTPYYVSLEAFEIKSEQFVNRIVTGYDKDKKPIIREEPWRIEFIQYVYNIKTKTYFLCQISKIDNGDGTYSYPLVSTYDPDLAGSGNSLDAYGWDGVYYFKTVVVQDFQGKAGASIPEGTVFNIWADFKSRGITERQTSKLIVTFPSTVEIIGPTPSDPIGVATIVRDEYQAIGTTKQYSIVIPEGNTAFFENLEIVNEEYCITNIIVTGERTATLSVTLLPTEQAIGTTIGFRIPYYEEGGGGYAIQYYLLKVTPVWFELNKLFYVRNHVENPIVVDDTQTPVYLKIDVTRTDDLTLKKVIDRRIADFETELNASNSVSWWGVEGVIGAELGLGAFNPEGTFNEYYPLLISVHPELVFTFVNDNGNKYITRNTNTAVTDINRVYGSYLRVMMPYSYDAEVGLPTIEADGRFVAESNQWVLDRKDWVNNISVRFPNTGTNNIGTPVPNGEWGQGEFNAIFGGGEYELSEDGSQIVVTKDGDVNNVSGSGQGAWDLSKDYNLSVEKSLMQTENMAVGTEKSFRIDIDKNLRAYNEATAQWYGYEYTPNGHSINGISGNRDIAAMVPETATLTKVDNGIIAITRNGSATKITYDTETKMIKVELDINSPRDRILRIEIPYDDPGSAFKRSFKLDIVPVLFTFDGYRLLNSADDPKRLVLGWPLEITLQADNIVRAPLTMRNEGNKAVFDDIEKSIADFNNSLTNVSYGDGKVEYFAYRGLNRVSLRAGEPNNTLNYKLSVKTTPTSNGIVKAFIEKSKDISASSYFGVSTKVVYNVYAPTSSDTVRPRLGAPILLGPNDDTLLDGSGKVVTILQRPINDKNRANINSAGQMVTVVSHAWRVETTASFPHPPEFPEPAYSVRFGMVAQIPTGVKNTGTGELGGNGNGLTNMLMMADSGDWMEYADGEQIPAQLTAWGGLPLVPADPVHPLGDGYTFVGWIPATWNYVYYDSNGIVTPSADGLLDSSMTLDYEKEVAWREIVPIDEHMGAHRAYSGEYLRTGYQINQDTIFLAVFRHTVNLETEVEGGPPTTVNMDIYDDPFNLDEYIIEDGVYIRDNTDRENIAVWRVNFYSTSVVGGEVSTVQDEQWVLNGNYAVAPAAPDRPLGLGSGTGWSGWYNGNREKITDNYDNQPWGNYPDSIESANGDAGINNSAIGGDNAILPNLDKNSGEAGSDIDYVAAFDSKPVGGPAPFHNVKFYTFTPGNADGMPLIQLSGQDGKFYNQVVTNGKNVINPVGKNPNGIVQPEYEDFTFVGWQLQMDSMGHYMSVEDANIGFAAGLSGNPIKPGDEYSRHTLLVPGEEDTPYANYLGYWYTTTATGPDNTVTETEEFRPLIIGNKKGNKLDIALAAVFEYHPIEEGMVGPQAIALGTTQVYNLSAGEKPDLEKLTVWYTPDGGDRVTMDFLSGEENGRNYFIMGSAAENNKEHHIISLSWAPDFSWLRAEMSMDTISLGSEIEIWLPFSAIRGGVLVRDLVRPIKLIPVYFQVEEITVGKGGNEYNRSESGKDNEVTSYSGEGLDLSATVSSYENYITAEMGTIFNVNEILRNEIDLAWTRFVDSLNQTDGIATEMLKLGVNTGRDDAIGIAYNSGSHQNEIYRTTNEAATSTLTVAAYIKYERGEAKIVKNDPYASDIVSLPAIYYNFRTGEGSQEIGNSPENPWLIWKRNADVLREMVPGTHYMLMEDIDLLADTKVGDAGWTPIELGSNPENNQGQDNAPPAYTSLNGNNFKILIRSNTFAAVDGAAENVGMFSVINPGSIVKNLQLVIYDDDVGIKNTTEVTFDLTPITEEVKGGTKLGMLAGTNKGIITNCAVLSGGQFTPVGMNGDPNIGPLFGTDGTIENDASGNFLADYSKSAFLQDKASSPGRMVVKVNNSKLDVFMGGLVGSNEGSVTNSRVMIDVELLPPGKTESTNVDNSDSELSNAKSAIVGGVVGKNSKLITATFFSDGNVINHAKPATITAGALGGFAGQNLSGGKIMASYVMGVSGGYTDANNEWVYNRNAENHFIASGAVIWSDRNSIGGFVQQNSGTIKDSLANVVLKKMGTEYMSGFVADNRGPIINSIANVDFVRVADLASQAQAFEFMRFNSSAALIDNAKYFSNAQNMAPGIANGLDKVAVLQPSHFVNDIFLGDNATTFLDEPMLSIKIPDANNPQQYIQNVKESVYKGFSMDGEIVANNNGSASLRKTSATYKKSIEEMFSQDINTIWRMTPTGPIPNSARYEIVYSMQRVDAADRYRPTVEFLYPGVGGHVLGLTPTNSGHTYGYASVGDRGNPLLVGREEEFIKYLAGEDFTDGGLAPGSRTASKSIRLINDIAFTQTPATYNSVYEEELFDGNGFTLSGVSNISVGSADSMSSIGLFAKTDNATFKNLNITVSKPSGSGSSDSAIGGQSYNYVGGLAGIAIDTNLIDMSVKSNSSGDSIVGGHIVGGMVGVFVATNRTAQRNVRVFNVSAQTALHSSWHSGSFATADAEFTTGREYYEGKGDQNSRTMVPRPTTGAGIPSVANDTYLFDKKYYYRENANSAAVGMSIVGNLFGVVTSAPRYSVEEAELFGRANSKKAVLESSDYIPIHIQNATGSAISLRGDVAGGLVGVMDRNTSMDGGSVTALGSITGKYYLGGMVGINLGTIENSSVTNVASIAAGSDAATGHGRYVYQNFIDDPTIYWGITVGGIAGYNNGAIKSTTSSATMSGANIYVVGGIVGQNDTAVLYKPGSGKERVNNNWEFGVIANDCSSSGKIQKGSVGFYFGNIIGRSADNSESASVWENETDVLVQSQHFFHATMPSGVPDPANPQKSLPRYVLFSAAAARHNEGKMTIIATPDPTPTDPERVTYRTTDMNKIQTYTLKEYLLYIQEFGSNWAVSEMADKLEPLVRGMPRMKAEVLYGRSVTTYKFASYPNKVRVDHGLGVDLDLEHFDMEEMKLWLKDGKVFNTDSKTDATVVFESYRHYLDDIQYPHYTTAVKNDIEDQKEPWDQRRVTGYSIGADYTTGAITLDEFKRYADLVWGPPVGGDAQITKPTAGRVRGFTMEKYVDYLKYKLAMKIDYDGNKIDPKTGLAMLTPVVDADNKPTGATVKTRQGVSMAEYRDWVRNNEFSREYKINGSKNNAAWYWPVADKAYYYGYRNITIRVGNDYISAWEMVAGGTAMDSDRNITIDGKTVTPNSRTWIRGTGANETVGYGPNEFGFDKIIDKSGNVINNPSAEEFGRDWRNVHDYFNFLQAKNADKALVKEGYFSTAIGVGPQSYQLYADWLYNDLGGMTLAEYVEYLKSPTLTKEETAYALAFGDDTALFTKTADPKDSLNLSFAQYRILTEYETRALGYDLRWYYTGEVGAEDDPSKMQPRGVGVTESEIEAVYLNATITVLTPNTVYLYPISVNADGSLGSFGGTPVNSAVSGYKWGGKNLNGSQELTWRFYKEASTKDEFYNISSTYINTHTAPLTPAVGDDPEVPPVRITFSEYLKIYNTRPDGLTDNDPDKNRPRYGSPGYDAAASEVVNDITASEDYIKLNKFGQYGEFSKSASLHDYKTAYYPAGDNMNNQPLDHYLFGISASIYGWTEDQATYIYDNLGKSLEWGVVGTFKSVLARSNDDLDADVSPNGTTADNIMTVISEGVFNNSLSDRAKKYQPNDSRYKEFAWTWMAADRDGILQVGGRGNVINPVTLNYNDSPQGNLYAFAPNAPSPTNPDGYGLAGNTDLRLLEMAKYWKDKTFTAVQFEKIKNAILFPNVYGRVSGLATNGTNGYISTTSYWTWAVLLEDYTRFIGEDSTMTPTEFVYIVSRGSFDEYTDFTDGANAGINYAGNSNVGGIAVPEMTRKYATDKQIYSIQKFGEVTAKQSTYVKYNRAGPDTDYERLDKSKNGNEPDEEWTEGSNTTTTYYNPIPEDTTAFRAYMMMLYAGGSVADFKINMMRPLTTPNPINSEATEQVAETFPAAKPNGVDGADIWNMADNIITITREQLPLTELDASGEAIWVGFIPRRDEAYTLILRNHDGGAAHPTYRIYSYDGSKVVAQGSARTTHGMGSSVNISTGTLSAGGLYLLRVSLDCGNESWSTVPRWKVSENKYSYAKYSVQISSADDAFALATPGEYFRTIKHEIEYTNSGNGNTTVSFSTGFPALSFYVDYMRRKKENGGNFISAWDYVNALDISNFSIPLDSEAWEKAAESDETKNKLATILQGTVNPEYNVNSSAVDLDDVVDDPISAVVNWALWNKLNGAEPGQDKWNKQEGEQAEDAPASEFVYKYAANAGSATQSFITYADYIDWLANYQNNEDLEEDRQTWLTFEAFCVWKRMEVWDKYYRGPYIPVRWLTDGGGSLENPWVVRWTIKGQKAIFPLDLNPLGNMENRGAYIYYNSNGEDKNRWIGAEQDSSEWYKHFEDLDSAKGGRDKGVQWSRRMSDIAVDGRDVYYEIQTGQILGSSTQRDGRVVPSATTENATGYNILHIEYEDWSSKNTRKTYDNKKEAHNANVSYYYNGNTIFEVVGGEKDGLFITFANPSFARFKQSALARYNSLSEHDPADSTKIIDTSAYDKYMHYWATHNIGLGNITWEGGSSTSSTGDRSFWRDVYNIAEYRIDGVYQGGSSLQSRKYMPLYQRMETPEEENTPNAIGETIVVTHW